MAKGEEAFVVCPTNMVPGHFCSAICDALGVTWRWVNCGFCHIFRSCWSMGKPVTEFSLKLFMEFRAQHKKFMIITGDCGQVLKELPPHRPFYHFSPFMAIFRQMWNCGYTCRSKHLICCIGFKTQCSSIIIVTGSATSNFSKHWPKYSFFDHYFSMVCHMWGCG